MPQFIIKEQNPIMGDCFTSYSVENWNEIAEIAWNNIYRHNSTTDMYEEWKICCNNASQDAVPVWSVPNGKYAVDNFCYIP